MVGKKMKLVLKPSTMAIQKKKEKEENNISRINIYKKALVAHVFHIPLRKIIYSTRVPNKSSSIRRLLRKRNDD